MVSLSVGAYQTQLVEPALTHARVGRGRHHNAEDHPEGGGSVDRLGPGAYLVFESEIPSQKLGNATLVHDRGGWKAKSVVELDGSDVSVSG